VLGANGEISSEGSVATTKQTMAQKFSTMRRCRIALEVGIHSPWLSRLLTNLGFEVIVANARQVPLITASSRKNDRMDARMLARLARLDPQLLRPIRHRSEQAQGDLMTIRVRAALVEARTSLVNAARGLAKSMGERLPSCDTDTLGVEKMAALPAAMKERLRPLLEQVEALTDHIHKLDTVIEQIARTQYPETELLKQVNGVGTLIALTFVLTVEDRDRFQKSGRWAVLWGCGRSRVTRARANRNSGSPRKATCIYASCWCKGRIVF
jgi:transposase